MCIDVLHSKDWVVENEINEWSCNMRMRKIEITEEEMN